MPKCRANSPKGKQAGGQRVREREELKDANANVQIKQEWHDRQPSKLTTAKAKLTD